jgi:hypothetical protein
VWFNDTSSGWVDERPHFHELSDEMFVVLEGAIVVEVAASAWDRASSAASLRVCPTRSLRRRRRCARSLIRAPSVDDKVYET